MYLVIGGGLPMPIVGRWETGDSDDRLVVYEVEPGCDTCERIFFVACLSDRGTYTVAPDGMIVPVVVVDC